jgi:protein-S-isoprenylcysteine O-methyltransferase Ste14
MPTVTRILIFAALGWMSFQILLVVLTSKMRSLGRPPISWPALALAKIAVTVSLISLLWTAVSGKARLSPLATILCLALLLGGTLVFTPALFGLGKNLRVGLPNGETSLVISGVYRFSRNPIYLGLFCYMGASLVYAFSWVNLAAVVTGALLHHRIVLAEERFLAAQFRDYGAYGQRVRRYL